MPFIKPPFFQPGSKPAASRGLGDLAGCVPVLLATENLSPDLAAIVAAEIAAGPAVTTYIQPTQNNLGLCYDRENRTLVYSVCVIDPNVTPQVNATGHLLWSGVNSILAGANYDPFEAKNFSIMTKSLDTGAVTRFDAWDVNSLVPAGIGGSDGTARRFVEAEAATPQLPKLCDPRTRNVWSHHTTTLGALTCLIYEFRFAEGYKQTISPYKPDANRHLELGGITDNWVLIGDLGKVGVGFDWQFLPRVRQADEVAADFLLSYGQSDEPVPLSEWFERRAFSADGTMWFFGRATFGAMDHGLWSLPMPPVVVNPVAPAAIAAVTPWGAANGPNTGAANYATRNTANDNSIIAQYQFTADRLVLLNKFYPNDKLPAATTDPADFRMHATYVQLPGLGFVTHADFVTGFMDANWNPSPVNPGNGYAVCDCWEADQADLAAHSFHFTNADYERRWLAFSVIPIVGGVLAAPYPGTNKPIAGGTHVVFAQYDFSAAPQLVALEGRLFTDEGLWDARYPAYGAAIGTTSVVFGSFATDLFNFTIYDQGVFDPVRKGWWWSGANTFAHFWKLNPAFTPRQPYMVDPYSQPILFVGVCN